MTAMVADASAFGPLFFADEFDNQIVGFKELVCEGNCLVPVHWRLEIANQLVMGLRRNRITESLTQELLAMTFDLPIAVDEETGEQMPAIYALAVGHRLTVYDAAYLELANRVGATLASFDKHLRRAATKHGIALLP